MYSGVPRRNSLLNTSNSSTIVCPPAHDKYFGNSAARICPSSSVSVRPRVRCGVYARSSRR